MTDDQRREVDGDLLIEREREMVGNVGDDEGGRRREEVVRLAILSDGEEAENNGGERW